MTAALNQGRFWGGNLTDPAYDALAVTPSDITPIGRNCRCLYIGAAGDLNVIMASGVTVLFKNVQVGLFPIQVSQVMATSTIASEIVALF